MKMKHIFFLLLIILFSLSCSDEKNDNDKIVGVWVLQYTTAKEVETNNDKATQIIKDDIASRFEGEGRRTLEYTSDGKFYNNNDQITGTYGTYSLIGKKITIQRNGKKETTPISITEDIMYVEVDNTEMYQQDMERLFPDEKNIVISKVITTYVYRRE